jgi:hypothetical protein
MLLGVVNEVETESGMRCDEKEGNVEMVYGYA